MIACSEFVTLILLKKKNLKKPNEESRHQLQAVNHNDEIFVIFSGKLVGLVLGFC